MAKNFAKILADIPLKCRLKIQARAAAKAALTGCSWFL
jgi:hypothetical protein